MDEKKYIKAIEELNKEYLDYTHSKIYLKNNRKRKIKRYLRNFEYKKILLAAKTFVYNRITKSSKITFQREDKFSSRKGKKVVYTCIVNNYDSLKNPVVRTEDTDYIVFSNNESVVIDNKYWQYRPISEQLKKKCNYNPILINRYIKMHPHELFPDYDLALYVDGNIRVISNIQDCFGYINDKTGLAMHEHAKRSDIYEEAKACIWLNKGNKKKIKNLIKDYKHQNFPHDFGLYQASIIAIDLRNKNAQEVLDAWYKEFVKRGTLRDQLSLPYVLWQKGYNYIDIGCLGSNIHHNVKFRVGEHKYKNSKLFFKVKNLKKRFKCFGFKYTCNICHSKVNHWLSGGTKHQIFEDNQIIGAGYRKNYKCPVCGMKDKDRLVYYYINKHTDMLKKANTILHFAPEKLICKQIKRKCKLNKKLKYYNCDINSDNADLVMDITNIDFPDNTFDYIICNHVLEHIKDEKKALCELKRVIKPTGKIIMTVPICISNAHTIEDDKATSPEERMNKFCQEDHVRLYGRDFPQRLAKWGLKVEEFRVNNPKLESKYGFLENGIIYIISK